MELPEFDAKKREDGWEVCFALPQKGYTKREAAQIVQALNTAALAYAAKNGNEDMDAEARAHLG